MKNEGNINKTYPGSEWILLELNYYYWNGIIRIKILFSLHSFVLTTTKKR